MIRDAELSDVVEYLAERGLVTPEHLNESAVIIDESMLLGYKEVEPLICEVHICVKKSAVRRAVELSEIAEYFLRLKGYQAMITAIEPRFKAVIKFAERIGFKRIGCYNDEILFCKEL